MENPGQIRVEINTMNDQFGHQAGDDVLKAVAKRLTSGTRAADAERYAHGIISDVAGQPYALDGSRSVHIGISVGFACSPDDGCAREELALKADAALYEAKAAGKGVHRRFCQGRTGFERRWRGCRERRRVRKQWAIDWMPPMQPREPASAAGARRNWAPLLYRKDRVMPGLEEPGVNPHVVMVRARMGRLGPGLDGDRRSDAGFIGSVDQDGRSGGCG